MNWLLIIVVLMLAFCIVNGYRKGFLRMLYSALAWLLAFAFISWATPYIDTYLREYTSAYETIEQYCEQGIRDKVQKQAEQQIKQGMAGGQENEEQKVKPGTELQGLGINLPQDVISNISQKTAEAADSLLDVSGVYRTVAEEIADFILHGIAFFIAMAIAMIALHLISRIFRVVSRIPILRGVNRYLGMALGAVYGIIIIWIAFYLIAICSNTEIGTALISYINESAFLTYLYENNLMITLVLLFF